MSTTLEQPPVEALSSPAERPYLFTADDFYRMIDVGVFPAHARVGLWEGRVHWEMAKKQAHSYSWAALNAALMPVLPKGWTLWAECSITIDRDIVPMPDLLILRGVLADFRTRRPTAADAALIVELAESSLKFDTGAKLAAYARAGVPVYWVVNLKDNLILVHESPIPEEGRYASVSRYTPGESVPFKLDGNQVALIVAADILQVP